MDKPGHDANLIENVRPLFPADSKTCQSFRFAFEATPSGLRVGVAVGESVPFKRGAHCRRGIFGLLNTFLVNRG